MKYTIWLWLSVCCKICWFSFLLRVKNSEKKFAWSSLTYQLNGINGSYYNLGTDFIFSVCLNLSRIFRRAKKYFILLQHITFYPWKKIIVSEGSSEFKIMSKIIYIYQCILFVQNNGIHDDALYMYIKHFDYIYLPHYQCLPLFLLSHWSPSIIVPFLLWGNFFFFFF
jgi:hypothetical protein